MSLRPIATRVAVASNVATRYPASAISVAPPDPFSSAWMENDGLDLLTQTQHDAHTDNSGG